MDFRPCTYRVSAKAIIISENGLLLVKEDSEHWDLPGGGIEHHEDPENALVREVREELGVEVNKIESDSLRAWTTYDNRVDRPLLFLLYRLNPKTFPVKSPDEKIEIKYFGREDLKSLDIEQHLEKYRQDLIKLAIR